MSTTLPKPTLVRSFDAWVLPIVMYEIETSTPEEDVAVALTGIAGAMHRDHWWFGHQRLRGGVKFGQIDYALVRRDRRLGPELFESDHNPLIWSSLLLLRGSIREAGGLTHVRLVFVPGYSTLLAVMMVVLAMVYVAGTVGIAWELAIAPVFIWLGLLVLHRASVGRIRALAFAALGLPAR